MVSSSTTSAMSASSELEIVVGKMDVASIVDTRPADDSSLGTKATPTLEQFGRELCNFDVTPWVGFDEPPADIWRWEMQHYYLFHAFYLALRMDEPAYFEQQLRDSFGRRNFSGLPFCPPGGRHNVPTLDSADKELEQLMRVRATARQFKVEGAPIKDWNRLVNIRILQMGLRSFPELVVVDAVQARIFPEFLPKQIDREAASHSIIDLCIGVSIDPASDTASAIGQILRRQPRGQKTINQTTFNALRTMPCVLPLKVFQGTDVDMSASQEDFLHQTLWASAYFLRFRKLEIPGPDVRKLTYPMICVRGTGWRLALARERDGKMNVFKTVRLGDTSELSLLYLLLNNLKILGQWVHEEFGRWFNNELTKFEECKAQWLLDRLSALPPCGPDSDSDVMSE